jgi:RND family efflux transporter MFP subunit
MTMLALPSRGATRHPILRCALAACSVALALPIAAQPVATAPSAQPVQPGQPGQPAQGVDCLIEPSQVLDIRSPVPGLIERVHAERGAAVRRGAPLVTLDSKVERAAADLSSYRAGMEGPTQLAQARLRQAQSRQQRTADLAAEAFTSEQAREDAEADVAVAQAELLGAREARELARLDSTLAAAQLAQRVVLSPIDGVVVEQNMHAGELADASEGRPPILRIAQTHPLRVRLILPAAQHPRVRAGQAVEVTPELPAGSLQRATVTSVDRVVDAASGTFQVRIDLPNPRGALVGGVRCRARIAGL